MGLGEVTNVYSLIAFVILLFTGVIQTVINSKKIKKTNKKVDELTRDDRQDKDIEELKVSIDEIARNMDNLMAYITRDKRANVFSLELISFYNDFLNKNLLDEDMKIIYQYAITQAGLLYKELISSDLEHLNNEIFYLTLKNKIINIYEKFKSVKKIKGSSEKLEKVKELIYREMDILKENFKIAKAQYRNGQLMTDLAENMKRFTERIFYKSYKILSQ